MRKSNQSVFCAHRNPAFILTAVLLLAAVVVSPANSFAKDNNSVLSVTVNSTVAVIDTHTNTIDDSVTVGRFPIAIATQQLKAHGDDNDNDHN